VRTFYANPLLRQYTVGFLRIEGNAPLLSLAVHFLIFRFKIRTNGSIPPSGLRVHFRYHTPHLALRIPPPRI
jgi:hypothetical protein